jgi:cytochrome b
MAEAPADKEAPAPVPVWDIGVRLFHWSLVLLVLVAWRSAEARALGLHRLAGAGVAGLVVFRLWWGVFGSRTARFTSFLKGPRTVLAYLAAQRSGAKAEVEPGHNPLGGWSVAALLLTVSAITIAGLFAVDTDGLESGPLARLVDFDAGRLASHIHALAFDGLEALVALHIAAILFYRFAKGDDLVRPMITGKKRLSSAPGNLAEGSRLHLGLACLLGLGVFALIAHASGAF